MQYEIRLANEQDVPSIALLHAQSWKTAYKDIYPKEYLESDLEAERLTYWTGRFQKLTEDEFILVADSGEEILGFASLFKPDKTEYGAKMDNLHVRPDIKRSGIGSRLLQEAAIQLLAQGKNSFYLWVLDKNLPARDFYLSKGGSIAGTGTSIVLGNEIPMTLMAWPDLRQWSAANQ